MFCFHVNSHLALSLFVLSLWHATSEFCVSLIEGFRPERCISTNGIYHCRDASFWSETNFVACIFFVVVVARLL